MTDNSSPIAAAQEEAEELAQDYGRPSAPLLSYAVISVIFNILMLTAYWFGRRKHRWSGVPDNWYDLTLLSVGAFRFGRLVSKDEVTSFARAPFTQFEQPAGAGELNEEPRSGWRQGFGELLTCPFCVTQWVAMGFMACYALAPNLARYIAGVFTISAFASVFQFLYDGLKQRLG